MGDAPNVASEIVPEVKEQSEEVEHNVNELKQEVNTYSALAGNPPIKNKPGALTKKSRRSASTPNTENAVGKPDGMHGGLPGMPAAWAPGHWNKFAREVQHPVFICE